MKWQNYTLIEMCLENALETIMDFYEVTDTSEDSKWSEKLDNVINEIRCLREEMIYTFTIDDVNQEIYKELDKRGQEQT